MNVETPDTLRLSNDPRCAVMIPVVLTLPSVPMPVPPERLSYTVM